MEAYRFVLSGDSATLDICRAQAAIRQMLPRIFLVILLDSSVVRVALWKFGAIVNFGDLLTKAQESFEARILTGPKYDLGKFAIRLT